MVRMRLAAQALLCLSCLLPATTILGQSATTTGGIEGTVLDESGGVLPGVSVALRNTATNYETTVSTGPNGRFRGPLLPLGPYRITATLQGFAKVVREGINVSVGQSVNLVITMQLAAKAAEVLVTAENPVIETTRPEGATRIDSVRAQGDPEQRPELPRVHEADPGRLDRPGTRRRRADRQRPEGDPEQRLGGRRGLQQPLLRRAARRPASRLHVQPRRGAGGRRRGRRRERRVRPLLVGLRERRHEVGDERRSPGP